MGKKQNTAQQWLETATKGIRFRPDRLAVEAELREHLEDKTADMARIFHIEGEEAEQEALKRMGDPGEVGKALAKLHKPWLGYLWLGSTVVLIILLTFFFFSLLRLVTDYHGTSLMRLREAYDPPIAVEPAQMKLGGYTFRIVNAQRIVSTPHVVNVNGTVSTEPDEIALRVVVRVSSPRFWERITTPDGCIPVVTVGGRRLSPTGDYTAERPEATMYVMNDSWSIFYRDYSFWIHGVPCHAGDWVKVEITYPIGTVELSAQVIER